MKKIIVFVLLVFLSLGNIGYAQATTIDANNRLYNAQEVHQRHHGHDRHHHRHDRHHRHHHDRDNDVEDIVKGIIIYEVVKEILD